MLSTVPHELGWLLITYAKNHAMLYAGRFITGVGCGMISVSFPVSIWLVLTQIYISCDKVAMHVLNFIGMENIRVLFLYLQFSLIS
jgi:hypothetical protein